MMWPYYLSVVTGCRRLSPSALDSPSATLFLKQEGTLYFKRPLSQGGLPLTPVMILVIYFKMLQYSQECITYCPFVYVLILEIISSCIMEKAQCWNSQPAFYWERPHSKALLPEFLLSLLK